MLPEFLAIAIEEQDIMIARRKDHASAIQPAPHFDQMLQQCLGLLSGIESKRGLRMRGEIPIHHAPGGQPDYRDSPLAETAGNAQPGIIHVHDDGCRRHQVVRQGMLAPKGISCWVRISSVVSPSSEASTAPGACINDSSLTILFKMTRQATIVKK